MNETKWRIANINGASIPSASFLTIQFDKSENYRVLPYRRDWRSVYSELADQENVWTKGPTGNLYGPWHEMSSLPKNLN